MNTSDTRPKFLNLLQIRLPVGGVASIAHRLSGLLLFLSLPLMAFLLERSLQGEEGFAAVGDLLRTAPLRLLSLILAWSIMHHLLAGIRFLILDMHIGMNKTSARRMAWVVNLAAPLLALLLIWRLW